MGRYLAYRLLHAVVVLLGVASLVFALLHLAPGDPVEVMLGERASVADRDALRQVLGLDRPLPEQWWQFVRDAAQGDLGYSLYEGRAAVEMVAERLPATAELAVIACALALLLSVPLGVVAAVRPHAIPARLSMWFATLGIAIPNFWLGPVLILVFSLWLGWLPVSGRDAPASVILPAITLGTSMAAILARMVRSSLLEVLHEDFVRTARAKGLAPLRVIVRHALANALLPVVTIVGLQLGALLAGAVITETIFSWPGIGLLTIESIQRRDYPVVQACVLVISLSYVLVNILTDLAYACIDPRVRLGAAR